MSQIVWCYEYEKWPVEAVIECLERLAGSLLSNRVSARFDSLRHPVHRQRAVYGWFVGVRELRSEPLQLANGIVS